MRAKPASPKPQPPSAAHPRRHFVLQLGAMAATLAGGSVLSGCGGGDERFPEFNYGVASGDPLGDRVILWTHARWTSGDDPVALRYEVAEDPAFARVVASGSTTASAATGFTAKVDATGLQPGRSYYYRFLAGITASPVGLTRTLPAQAEAVRLAVMSCSNYPAGFFNVYAAVAASSAEFAVHLGDFIYEYGAGGYASANAAALGRVSEPAAELLSLDDYRRRHAQYKSDPDSKNLHARMPLIAVWDDHEVANDAYTDGAENHSPATEGPWAARRAAALQAYHEWMPIRSGPAPERIYRSFDFGGLLSLHMLDTRLIGREQPIDIAALAGAAGPAAQGQALTAYSSPTRQLLGAEQLAWLQGQMAASSATWQVLGQQVLMARIEFPVSVLAALNTSDTSPEAVAAGAAAVTAFLTAKATPPALRTPEQQVLMDPVRNPLLGYNLDAWDGYLAARETVLGTALQLNKRLVVLAGDTHNAWHSDLTLKGLANPALAGLKVGEEFATASVSSPGLEAALPLPPAQTKAIFEGVADDLKWMDPARRGYLLMQFSAAQVQADWVFVDSIAQRSFNTEVGRSAVLPA